MNFLTDERLKEILKTKIDSSGYPELDLLNSVEDQALLVLGLLKEELDISYASASQIAAILTEKFGVATSRQAVLAALKKVGSKRGGKKVSIKGVGRKLSFSIMESGLKSIKLSAQNVWVIEPEKNALDSLKNFEQLLKGLSDGVVRVVDPHVDKTTLDFLSLAPPNSSIRLLTVNIHNLSGFRRYLQALNRQGGNLSVRLYSKILHDRYIIDENQMYLLGQSINGISKRQTFIVLLGQDIRNQIVKSFDEKWGRAKKFI